MTVSDTLLERFPVRKSAKQKEEFRTWLCDTLREAGYDPRIKYTKGYGNSNNVVVGDLVHSKVILTAHYDTCAVLPFPNFVTPCSLLFTVLYVLVLAIALLAVLALVELVLLPKLGVPNSVRLISAYVILAGIILLCIEGKANKSNVNDNSSGVITLLETALSLPEEERGKVLFIFFDNEEKGMLGSSAFIDKYRPVLDPNALTINFDCVGDGDHILLFPVWRVLKREEALRKVEEIYSADAGEKEVRMVKKGFRFYPSDQMKFTRGIGVAALHYKKSVGYYLGRIHTKRDTVLDRSNIDLLREANLRYISSL